MPPFHPRAQQQSHILTLANRDSSSYTDGLLLFPRTHLDRSEKQQHDSPVVPYFPLVFWPEGGLLAGVLDDDDGEAVLVAAVPDAPDDWRATMSWDEATLALWRREKARPWGAVGILLLLLCFRFSRRGGRGLAVCWVFKVLVLLVLVLMLGIAIGLATAMVMLKMMVQVVGEQLQVLLKVVGWKCV